MKKLLSASLVLSIALTRVSPASADEWTTEQKAGMYAAGAKYGLTTIRAIAVSSDSSFSPPTGNVSETQRQALEKTLSGYVAYRQSSQGTLMALRGGAEFLVDSTAITMTATGVGAVPAAIFKATAQVASDAFFQSMEGDIKQSMEVYLKKLEPKLISAAGGDYESLRQKTPEQIKASIDQQTNVFAEIKSMVGNDDLAQKRAEGMVIQAILNTSKATLDRISATDTRLGTIEQKFLTLNSAVKKFEETTTATLQKHSDALAGLQSDMSLLQEAVGSIDNRLRIQERNSAFVTDFVFDRMDPSSKAAALRAGFMSERFVCPPGSGDCGGPALKADLIKRFDAEARVQVAVGLVRETANNLNNVATIAGNLGINIPGLPQAVQYGNIAANAFTAFASGNYLGAIAAVSSVFAKRIDPDEERFKVLMSYLAEQFKQINAKLDEIIINQKKMMEALVKLSEQMRTYFVALDERLARMEFELRRVSEAARVALWAPWTSCQAVYDHVRSNEKSYRYFENGDFQRLEDIYSAVGTIGNVARECAIIGQTRPASIGAANWFGNLLNAYTAVTETPEVLPNDEAVRGETHTKKQLQAFIDSIHAPARDLTIDFLRRYGVESPRGVELLMSPALSYVELSYRSKLKPNGAACGSYGYLQERAQRLLCLGNSASSAAIELIRTPMVVDLAIQISDWLLVTSRFADLIDQQSNQYIAKDALLKHAASTATSKSPGRDILEKAQVMLDAAVASYTILYGDLTASAAFDALFGPVPGNADEANRKAALAQSARTMLRQNPVLASNVAMIFLQDRYRRSNGYAADEAFSPLQYRNAYLFALAGQVDPAFYLRGIFGEDVKFVVERENNRVMLNLTGSDLPADKIMVALPEPSMFAAGRFIYPQKMTGLFSMRQRIAERLADYSALSHLNATERSSVVTAVARSEQQPK